MNANGTEFAAQSTGASVNKGGSSGNVSLPQNSAGQQNAVSRVGVLEFIRGCQAKDETHGATGLGVVVGEITWFGRRTSGP